MPTSATGSGAHPRTARSCNASLNLGNASWFVRPNVSFNVTNILDETAVKGGHVASTVAYGTLPLYVLSPPRTFTVRLGLEF